MKVIDINEAPTGIDIGGNRSVTENVAEGTIIGDLSTYDAEKYQNYTYSLLGVNYGRVSIIVETSGDSALYKWYYFVKEICIEDVRVRMIHTKK